MDEGKGKVSELNGALKSLENATNRLRGQYTKAQQDINDTFDFCLSLLEELKKDAMKDLDDQYSNKLVSLTLLNSRIHEAIDKMNQTEHLTERFNRKYSNSSSSPSPNELLNMKESIESRLRLLVSFDSDVAKSIGSDLDFVSNYQSIRASLKNSFGYIRSSAANDSINTNPAPLPNKQPPISRPNGLTSSSVSSFHSSHQNGYDSILKSSNCNSVNSNTLNRFGSNLLVNGSGITLNGVTSNGIGSGDGGCNDITLLPDTSNCIANGTGSSRSFSTGASLTDTITNMYEKWSIGGSGSPDSTLFPNGTSSLLEHLSNAFSDPVIDLTGKLMNGGSNVTSNGSLLSGSNLNSTGSLIIGSSNGSVNNGTCNGLVSSSGVSSVLGSSVNSTASLLPIKSQIKRQKMIYHCKFGEFGVMEGQFTEPSGVAVNAQNDIIVADTNNHRIQIFDKEGRFKFQFGECGKRDGQLLYPNRVAVVRSSGDIIVTERSPTHQIQIYNQYGQFVRKFGANILQHPRGVTVDNKGRVIVVECKVMRVLIFDQMGNVIHKFGCSKHLEFPNGVVVNDKQEIFISDNRAHCVKVFSYEGHFLRQIGGEGLTNYPIGVSINDAGEILVADNHNNFNITIFTQDGRLMSALESKVKHAQCFDVALMDDNSVILASKDYRIYIYRYLQLQSLAQAVAASSLC